MHTHTHTERIETKNVNSTLKTAGTEMQLLLATQTRTGANFTMSNKTILSHNHTYLVTFTNIFGSAPSLVIVVGVQ